MGYGPKENALDGLKDLSSVGNINKRISQYKKMGYSDPSAIQTTAMDKNIAEGRQSKSWSTEKAIQNKNPQSSVFTSGTTENLKSNNGHKFL